MRNRVLCRQLRLGKNRSQQLVSIDLCFCYVYRLTFEKVGDCKCLLPIGIVSARGLVPTVKFCALFFVPFAKPCWQEGY
jgi:hypothetical protein